MTGISSQFVNMSSDHNSAISIHEGGEQLNFMVNDLEGISHRLRATREALGKNQAEICRDIDCQPNRWNQYETGERRITLEIADRLCRRYGLTLDWIYRGDPSGLPNRFSDLANQAA